MNEIKILLDQHKYIRTRLLGLLKEIEEVNYSEDALHWSMPFGKGRAHLGWQFMHCAATYDRYLNFRILNQKPNDEKLISDYAGGSVPDTKKTLTISEIKSTLEKTIKPFYEYFESLDSSKINEKPHKEAEKTHKEILELLNWHEASHNGQAQITWNSFRAFRGHI